MYKGTASVHVVKDHVTLDCYFVIVFSIFLFPCLLLYLLNFTLFATSILSFSLSLAHTLFHVLVTSLSLFFSLQVVLDLVECRAVLKNVTSVTKQNGVIVAYVTK